MDFGGVEGAPLQESDDAGHGFMDTAVAVLNQELAHLRRGDQDAVAQQLLHFGKQEVGIRE